MPSEEGGNSMRLMKATLDVLYGICRADIIVIMLSCAAPFGSLTNQKNMRRFVTPTTKFIGRALQVLLAEGREWSGVKKERENGFSEI